MEKDELTYKIIGCAMKVHNTLGNGFQEVIYQRCLAIETTMRRSDSHTGMIIWEFHLTNKK